MFVTLHWGMEKSQVIIVNIINQFMLWLPVIVLFRDGHELC